MPVAAISVSVPTDRLTGDLDLKIPERVRQRARAISARLKQNAPAKKNRETFRSQRGGGGQSA